jgi:hypothetical protein
VTKEIVRFNPTSVIDGGGITYKTGAALTYQVSLFFLLSLAQGLGILLAPVDLGLKGTGSWV